MCTERSRLLMDRYRSPLQCSFILEVFNGENRLYVITLSLFPTTFDPFPAYHPPFLPFKKNFQPLPLFDVQLHIVFI